MGLLSLKQIEPFEHGIVDITYAALLVSAYAGNYERGQWYFITDRNIWVKTLESTSERAFLGPKGYYKRYVLPFQGVNFLGIWYAGMPGIAATKWVGWDDLCWENKTGVNGVSDPSNDPTNWKISTRGGGNYLGTWSGLWVGASAGETCKYGDLYYLNLTGAISVSNPSVDTTNWVLMSQFNENGYNPTGLIDIYPQYNSRGPYIIEIYDCEYDFWNDWLFEVKDHRGNEIGNSWAWEQKMLLGYNIVEKFQWGRDTVFENISIESQFENVNAVGSYYRNYFWGSSIHNNIFNSSGVYFTDNHLVNSSIIYNTISYYVAGNTLRNAIISNKITTGTAIIGGYNLGGISWGIAETVSSSSTYVAETSGEKVADANNSNIKTTLDLDDALIFSGGVLTIPTYMIHVGTFILDGASSNYTITKILNHPTLFSTTFKSANTDLIFSPTPRATAVAGNILSDGPRTITFNTNGTDSIVFKREGTFIVKQYDTKRGLIKNIISVAANYTLTEEDYTVKFTGTFTATLPDATLCKGQEFNIKDVGAGVTTINTTGGQLIDTFASGVITLTNPQSLRVQSDGANYIIL